MTKRGLEISGIGVIDIDFHACLHLEAVQKTPTGTLEQVSWILIDWYLHVLRTRKAKLQQLTHYVVADMQRFISVLGIKTNQEINRRLWKEGIKFAAIAA